MDRGTLMLNYRPPTYVRLHLEQTTEWIHYLAVPFSKCVLRIDLEQYKLFDSI